MASRFWAAGSDSEEESESEVEETSSEEESDSSSSSDEGSQKKGPSRFMIGSSDSDSEDDKRVIRSAKDRRFDELQATCHEIRNKVNINDWSSVQSLFDKLNKQLEKTQKVTDAIGVPRVYVRILVELEDGLKKTLADKDAKKKMSPTNAKALNTMRQRLKKHNVSFQEQIDKFRENPESTEEEPSDASDDESGSDDGSDEDEEQEDLDVDGFEKIKTKGEKKKDKFFTMDPTQISFDMVRQKLKDIVMTRGKRGVDRNEQVEMLTYLATVAKGPVQKLEVLIQVVSALFDINPSMSTHMSVPLWKRCAGTLLEVLQTLADNDYIEVDEMYDNPEERTEEPPAGQPAKVWGNLVGFIERLDDELFKSLQVLDPHTNLYLERMKDEPLFLALAQKVTEYLERLRDVRGLSKMALRRVEHLYYKNDLVYGAMRKLVQQQQAATAQQTTQTQQEGSDEAVEAEDLDEDETEAKQADQVTVKIPADFHLEEDLAATMTHLSTFIYKHGDERSKARTMLCCIFFEAIHDDFYRARDMMLMSHLQDNVQHMDISTQILYNRTMAQLGLAAFRAALVNEAQSALSEMYGSGRVKELLAQGMSMSRYQDKTPEQEKLERRRQMPFHMHINLELLESVHLIAAMLLETPNMAATGLAAPRRVISKPFRRLLDNYERQTFTGPPENVRDHVMAATKSIMGGHWQEAYHYLSSLSVWNLIGGAKENVLVLLKAKLQECGLKTYLFSYGSYYSSLSLKQLSEMFELPEMQVHSIVSKLMMDDKLHGSWDQPTSTIVMHNAEPSRLQSLAMQFADKAATMVDLNERALTLRTGGMRESEDDMGRGYQEGGGGRRGGRGRGGLPGMGRGGSRGGMLGGRGGRMGGTRFGDRSDRYGTTGLTSNVSSLPDRFQRSGAFRQQQNPNMQSIGQFTSGRMDYRRK
ncbi:hypothetical protein WJX77_002170 [Trebouxia sp. C0004]